MPHYADGTECKVGDQVIAPVFNSGGPKAGVVISITPGAESCNAMVQFTEVVPFGGVLGPDPESLPTMPALPRMAVANAQRIVKGEQHGNAGPHYIAFVCADYCDTNKLTKVG